MNMIGIIDVGGGLRGIYSAGIYDYCLDNNINFDYCIGVSAGSGNIASYLAKQRGRNYTFYIDYTFRKDYMSLHSLFKTGSYINLDYIYGNLSGSNGENPLNYQELMRSKSIFKIVATNALTGKATYFDKSDAAQDNYDIFKASCCIPIVCKPYYINGIPYFDGGLADPIPIKKAFEDGCDQVVVILTKPFDYIISEKSKDIIAKLLAKKYPECSKVMFNQINKYNEGITLLKKYVKEGRVLVICPDDCCGVDTLTKNVAKMKKLYAKGFNDAQAILTFIQPIQQSPELTKTR